MNLFLVTFCQAEKQCGRRAAEPKLVGGVVFCRRGLGLASALPFATFLKPFAFVCVFLLTLGTLSLPLSKKPPGIGRFR